MEQGSFPRSRRYLRSERFQLDPSVRYSTAYPDIRRAEWQPECRIWQPSRNLPCWSTSAVFLWVYSHLIRFSLDPLSSRWSLFYRFFAPVLWTYLAPPHGCCSLSSNQVFQCGNAQKVFSLLINLSRSLHKVSFCSVSIDGPTNICGSMSPCAELLYAWKSIYTFVSNNDKWQVLVTWGFCVPFILLSNFMMLELFFGKIATQYGSKMIC